MTPAHIEGDSDCWVCWGLWRVRLKNKQTKWKAEKTSNISATLTLGKPWQQVVMWSKAWSTAHAQGLEEVAQMQQEHCFGSTAPHHLPDRRSHPFSPPSSCYHYFRAIDVFCCAVSVPQRTARPGGVGSQGEAGCMDTCLRKRLGPSNWLKCRMFWCLHYTQEDIPQFQTGLTYHHVYTFPIYF